MISMLATAIALLALQLDLLSAIPVDNSIVGTPEIDCGPTDIGVMFTAKNNFEGHTFVKGRFAEEGCRKSGDNSGPVATLSLGFEDCGVKRTRSVNPQGIFVSVTVVIMFHPQFITKVDRAYKIQCFYMEAEKTVSEEIEVSMLTTQFRTQVVPVPDCKYEILDGPQGISINYAFVGQAVFHKWDCSSETIDTFCMVVHSCYVQNEDSEQRIDLLDPQGCALDRYLLGNLEYVGNLASVKENHVFKYADKTMMFFQCQITLSIKEPNEECVRPDCPEPIRGKRSIGHDIQTYAGPMDASVIDVNAQFSTLTLPDNQTLRNLNRQADILKTLGKYNIDEYKDVYYEEVCLTMLELALMSLFLAGTAATALSVAVYLIFGHTRQLK